MYSQIGIIRVVTTSDDHVLYAHEKIIKSFLPSLNIVTQSIPDQLHGIYDSASEEVAIPKIIKLALEMELAGMDGIIISCCTDPALDLVREKVKIPVVGAGQAACLMAKAISTKVGVTSLTDQIPENLKNQLGNCLVAYQKVQGISNTLDLLNKSGKESVIQSANFLISQGAQCILLGCTGMATIGIANFIEQDLNIPVVDPIVASGSLINYLVNRNKWQVRA